VQEEMTLVSMISSYQKLKGGGGGEEEEIGRGAEEGGPGADSGLSKCFSSISKTYSFFPPYIFFVFFFPPKTAHKFSFLFFR
jgi:hypothetical protein